MNFRYLSLFSGIEAASVAWLPLGWECVGFAEIEKFPCDLLKHYYPDVPNLGSVTEITELQIKALGHIDLVVGGFPCQDLSVAGKRKGLKNEDGSNTRSGLFYDAMRIVRLSDARYCLLENVSGIYSSNRGRDFASMVGEILGVNFNVPTNGWQNIGVAASERGLLEWSTLDAQWFGVPQRRRRMFALADFGNWKNRPPILFEQHSLQGHSAPSRKKGQEVTEVAGKLAANGGGLNRPAGNANELDFCVVAPQVASGKETIGTLMANAGTKQWLGNQEALSGDYHILQPIYAIAENTIGRKPENGGNGNGYSEDLSYTLNATGVHGVCAPIAFNQQASVSQGLSISEDVVPTLDKSKVHGVAHVFKVRGGCDGGGKGYLGSDDAAFTLSTNQDQHLFYQMAVRRLTPLECERLQGFPDFYSKLNDKTADAPRYKALGNSMAVPVMRWIGERIELVNKLSQQSLELVA